MLKRADALRVAVLCSRRAPGLNALLFAGDQARYRVVGVVTTDPASNALPDTAGAGVSCVVHDISAFYRACGRRLTDRSVRPVFDAETARVLGPWKPDVVVLCGYLHVLTGPMLGAFPGRIINIHDSDLCLTGDDDRPRYRGLRSTRDAVTAGEPETRSTIHVVTEDVDVGPLLVRSWSFPVHLDLVEAAHAAQATDVLKAYAYAQREWMLRAAWGRMLHVAVDLHARGEVRVLGNCAYLRGAPGPLTLPEPRAFAGAETAP
jgi:phosphoribosylglycinamide formyltransferase-1